MATLTPEQIAEELQNLQGWEQAGDKLRKDYTFNTYKDGAQFASQVAEVADEMNHHPDLTLGYKKVSIELTSHDAGGITDRDIRLARRIESLHQGAGLAF